MRSKFPRFVLPLSADIRFFQGKASVHFVLKHWTSSSRHKTGLEYVTLPRAPHLRLLNVLVLENVDANTTAPFR